VIIVLLHNDIIYSYKLFVVTKFLERSGEPKFLSWEYSRVQ
jgi:hypothetical protein